MSIITARTPQHFESAISLFKEYATGLGIDLSFQNFDAELHKLPIMYGPPQGELWLIEQNGHFVGCAALRQLDANTCELKRMYIQPAYRGQQWGEKLMNVALETAQNLQYKVIKLDSLRRLEPAVKLYKKFGFRETLPYNHNPEPDVVYFELQLRY